MLDLVGHSKTWLLTVVNNSKLLSTKPVLVTTNKETETRSNASHIILNIISHLLVKALC